VPFGSALYRAGADLDDLVVSLDGVAVASQDALNGVLAKHTPGDRVPLRFVRRSGETVNTTLALEEDPQFELVAVEQAGGTLRPEQKQFRDAWLSSKVQGGAKPQ
jgi:predicted metalloprotease with PDZ domain